LRNVIRYRAKYILFLERFLVTNTLQNIFPLTMERRMEHEFYVEATYTSAATDQSAANPNPLKSIYSIM
jgi:hypothetical protein